MSIDNFNINDRVMVNLKEGCYFSPWDGTKEVSLLPEGPKMERDLLGISESGFNEQYKKEKFKEKGIIAIRTFAGFYMGSRQGLIKVKPFYGLQNIEAEYFIIREDQINKISTYHLNELEVSLSD